MAALAQAALSRLAVPRRVSRRVVRLRAQPLLVLARLLCAGRHVHQAVDRDVAIIAQQRRSTAVRALVRKQRHEPPGPLGLPRDAVPAKGAAQIVHPGLPQDSALVRAGPEVVPLLARAVPATGKGVRVHVALVGAAAVLAPHRGHCEGSVFGPRPRRAPRVCDAGHEQVRDEVGIVRGEAAALDPVPRVGGELVLAHDADRLFHEGQGVVDGRDRVVTRRQRLVDLAVPVRHLVQVGKAPRPVGGVPAQELRQLRHDVRAPNGVPPTANVTAGAHDKHARAALVADHGEGRVRDLALALRVAHLDAKPQAAAKAHGHGGAPVGLVLDVGVVHGGDRRGRVADALAQDACPGKLRQARNDVVAHGVLGDLVEDEFEGVGGEGVHRHACVTRGLQQKLSGGCSERRQPPTCNGSNRYSAPQPVVGGGCECCKVDERAHNFRNGLTACNNKTRPKEPTSPPWRTPSPWLGCTRTSSSATRGHCSSP